MWIIHYDYVGALSAMVLLQLSSDGFLIYRFYFVWERFLTRRWPLALACVLWTVTVGLGVILCFFCSALNGNLFAGEAANIGIAYYTVAITLNILVTSMSYIQVRTHGQRLQEQSSSGISQQLFGPASFIIEPALPRTIIGLVFLITFALDSGASVALLSLYVMLTCVCPQMLMLHVASEFVSNQALEVHTFTPASSPMKLRLPMPAFNYHNCRRDSDVYSISSCEKSSLEVV
ncbi:hypothetical protein V8B97DRAFT_689166 [Scleroderma yunnanense]